MTTNKLNLDTFESWLWDSANILPLDFELTLKQNEILLKEYGELIEPRIALHIASSSIKKDKSEE
jgi:hypothetical protein